MITMNDTQKLQHVLSELKRVALPDEQTNPQEYWNQVEWMANNATDTACDLDIFIKNLIKYIEQ